MRRHVPWIVLLLLAPTTYALASLLGWWLSTQSPAAGPAAGVGIALGGLLAAAVAVFAPIVFLILAIVQMARVYRRRQRVRGNYTPQEQRLLETQTQAARAWEHARSVRSWLIERRVPATLQQWDVIPDAGEVFFARLNLQYARYYGRDVSYTTRGGFFFGHPAFVVGALAVTAISNSRSKSNAQAQAAAQWREWQSAVVYVTNQRLVVHVSGVWLTFSYSAMAAIYPEVSALTLVCQFSGAEPMLLTGADAPIAAVYAVLQTYGPDALASHPSLQPLNRPAPAPALPAIGKERSRSAA